MNKLIFSDGTEVQTIGPIELTPEERARNFKKCLSPHEATFEVDLSFNPLTLWHILTGMKITNNYLKYHGGVLQRRRQIEKLRKRKGDIYAKRKRK